MIRSSVVGRGVRYVPTAARRPQACADAMQQVSLDDEAAFARSGFAMQYLSKTADYKEGPRAFIEKRAPVWTGVSGAKADKWLAEKLALKQNSKL